MEAGTESIRAFISIEPEPNLLEALDKIQRELDTRIPRDSVRWATAGQLHLTLKFLGNVPTSALAPLQAGLLRASQGHQPFELRPEGLGCFPNARNPRVIWVGLRGDVELLQKLQANIEQVAKDYAEKEEKRAFRPHLTLGRVRENAGRQARQIGEALEGFVVPPLSVWPVRQFNLMRSQLSPKGAIHTKVAEFPLVPPAELS